MPRVSARSSVAVGSIVLLVLTVFAGTPSAQTIDDSVLKTFQWRNIGPANMGGRTVDIEGVDSNPKTIYAGTATSGIWKTVNAGTTWEPIFDDQPVVSIGDLAVYQRDPDILYVGTGEANGRNSSPWGGGVYKSTDGGASWQFMGLKETHHIGRVLIDPDDPDVAFVASVGHLWAPNPERGVFKTTDGGRTWRKVLFINDETGVTDLVMDPADKNRMVAAAYERQRDAFSGGNPVKMTGPGSGIFVSSDAGETWQRVTEGLPGVDMGRIGLSASRSRPGNVYAIIQTASQGGGFGGGGGQQQDRPLDVDRGGIFKSTDYGHSWTQQSEYNSRPFYYSQIRVDPNNDNIIWIGGTQMGYTADGGVTVRSGAQVSGPTHIDYHAAWVDPNDSDHVVYGSDGGISVTYDSGQTWDMYVQQPMAQFYAITADMRKPYYVYGGLQDNGSWGGPSRTRSQYGIRNEDWYMLSWGDGFYAQVEPTDFNIVYTESQNGNLSRIDLRTGQRRSIRPRGNNIGNMEAYYPSEGGQQQAGGGGFGGRSSLRFDWNSPVMISQHNPTLVYFAGNHLFKSLNRGDNWMIISPDLTLAPTKSDRKARAIVSIDESPLNPDVLWAGSNDGNVWLTRDGGASWTRLNENIPGAPHEYWVKRVEASNHVEGRAYLVFDGHRNDDINPYVFVTEDFGESWTKISNNMPEGAVYVVREDYHNPNLLFAGTSYAVFISLNRGVSWTRFMNNMPTAPVHDLYIHPRDGDLIAGTHGRGAWIADNITALQQLTPEVMEGDGHLFDVRPATLWVRPSGQYPYQSDKMFRGENPPNGPFISYYLKSKPRSAELVISDISGAERRTQEITDGVGLHTFQWERRFDPNQQRMERYVTTTRMTLDRFLEQATERDQRRRIESLKSELEDAGTDLARLRAFQSSFNNAIRSLGLPGGFGGRGRGGGGSLTGSEAGAGQYLVTLVVDGKVMSTTLLLEEDRPGYIVR
jgi:photosystem II stability/assembly factor-like uncharacterized protein